MEGNNKKELRLKETIEFHTYHNQQEEDEYKSEYLKVNINDPLQSIDYVAEKPNDKKAKKTPFYLKFITAVFDITKRGLSMLDAITDLILLYSASQDGNINDRKIFIIILCISLLSPYILSYSSGIELFLYRKTFENHKILSSKSILLILYILPTGILYYIIIDILDAILSIFRLFYVIRGESSQEFENIESNIYEYFGMSQMDASSFRKQKAISQLFFETIPQCCLQSLLYLNIIPGKELTGVTDQALLLSLLSALSNCIITIFELNAESHAVNESFVEYALHCITARFGWVPFQFILIDYFSGNLKNNDNTKRCCSCKLFAFKLDSQYDKETTLIINYGNIHYRIPIITYLSKETLKRSIQYKFSENTLRSLMATIKSTQTSKSRHRINEIETAFDLQIKFGKSLNLLTVRQIISLMQCCKLKNIILPDIDKIDWYQIFNNCDRDNDPRLYSNTFDQYKRSLLISLYLTGYDNNNWEILRKFIYDFDVPINEQDYEGNTILHHMLKKEDEIGIKVLFDSLRPNQRINFDIQNDEGVIIMHEIINKYQVQGLKDALNILKPRQKINFNILDPNDNTIFHHLIKKGDINLLKDILFIIDLNSTNDIDLTISNKLNESIIYLALENDKKHLSLKKNNANNVSIKNDVIEEFSEDQQIEETEDEIEDHQIDKMEENEWDKFAKNWLLAAAHSVINPRTMINSVYLKVNQMIAKLIPSDAILTTKIEYIQLVQEKIAYLYKKCPQRDSMPFIFKQEIQRLQSQLNHDDVDEDEEEDEKEADIKEDEEIEIMQDYKEKMMHSIILKYDSNINLNKQQNSQESVLKYVLENYQSYNEYQEIVNNLLLYDNIKLLATEIPIFIKLFTKFAFETNCEQYFILFENVLNENNINIDSVLDSNGNTPINYLVKQHKNSDSIELYLIKLNKLCARYPQWLNIKDKTGLIPIYNSLINRDFDGFIALARFMSEQDNNALNILSTKFYIEKMIGFGASILRKPQKYRISLLLQLFDYFEVFYYPSSKMQINDLRNELILSQTDKDKKKEDHFISLIHYLSSTANRKKKNGYDNDPISILFEFCNLKRSNHEKELKNQDKDFNFEEVANNEIIINWNDYYNDIGEEIGDMDDLENMDNLFNNTKNKNISLNDNDDLFIEEKKYINWMEIIYSTIVESFSVMDLYTDIIIFFELYQTNNPWWSTCMVLLIISPYLVSYGALSTLLLQKLNYFRNAQCLSLFVLLLMTPLSILYLFIIDLIFMIYSLSSTFIFIICGCNPKYDIKDYLDEYIFNTILRMNRTEIIGYRRLRTLSQLAFETIPQLILQGRILYVINVKNENNQFKIDINTLIWSMTLAFLHLLLEGGVIYLDSNTLKMQFIQYCMICLGGRVQWIPYQHFFQIIIQNQLFMENVFDINHSDKVFIQKQIQFDGLKYSVNCKSEQDNDNDNDNDYKDDIVKKNVMALNYDDIQQYMICFRYEIIYQFSNGLMQHLIQQLINSPSMIIPRDFKLSSINISLQNLMRNILCRSELHLGYKSCGNVNITSLTQLYEASLNKLKLNINKIDLKTVNKIKRNSNFTKDVDTFKQIINSILISHGEIGAIKWIYDDINNLSYDDKININFEIAQKIFPSENTPLINLVCLRNCFKNKYFIGFQNCALMERVKNELFSNEYKNKCAYDGSWCYVFMIFLFYYKGSILWTDCINGCCKNITKQNGLNRLFFKYLPSFIKYKDMLIPYQIFECSKLFKYYQKEQILINQCKNWIILNDEAQKNNKPNDIIQINDIYSSDIDECKYIGNADYNEDITKLLNHEIEYEHVALLDELVYKLKLYQNYNNYLNKTSKYRTLINSRIAKFDIKKDEIVEIKLHQLIPDWTENNQKRHQIYQVMVTTSNDIQQIYFKNINEKTSLLNDMIYLYNEYDGNHNDIDDNDSKYDQQEIKSINIDQNNVGLSYFNYNLLHHTQNIPTISIGTSSECTITVFIKYSHLYHENDVVVKNIHPEMSLFAYSKLLYDNIQLNHYVEEEKSEGELMNFCFEMALWITLPNKAIFERDFKDFMDILTNCELIRSNVIAQIIVEYIVHPRNYMHWQQFATFEHASLEKKECIYLQDQLVYQCGDNMVDYRNAQRDFINVPTPIFDRDQKIYHINILILGKGDESIFALVPVSDYEWDAGIRYLPQETLGITGGRMSDIRRSGRFKTSDCTGYIDDCNHGVVKKGRNVIQHPLDAHLPGDWLNFIIDLENNILTFYRNGIYQTKVEGQIPDGDLFMLCHPDTAQDKFYIEEDTNSSFYQQLAANYTR